MNSYAVTAETRFGGFVAELTGCGLILVRAESWKGRQPRIVLLPRDVGYADWRKLLDSPAAQIDKTVEFPQNDAAGNLADQWLAH